MGDMMSCESNMTNIDDTSEPFHRRSSSLSLSSSSSLNDDQIGLFRCGCCQMDAPDGMDDEQMMESHKMEARNAAASYRNKLLHVASGGSEDGVDFDLNAVHPSSPPFLGTSYWMSMDDGDEEEEDDDEDDDEDDEEDGGDEDCDSDSETVGHGETVGDGVAAFLEVLSDTVGIVTDQSVRTRESINTSIGSSSTHTSCITASTRELESSSYVSQEMSYLQSPSHSSPNFIIQNSHCTVSTPCDTPQLQLQQTLSHEQQSQLQVQSQPSLAASSVSTTTTCSSASSIHVAKVETARRLFGDRDDLLYNQDMSPNLDPILISRDYDSDQEEDYCNSMRDINNSMNGINTYSVPISPGTTTTTTSQTHPPIPDTNTTRGSPCTPNSQHSPRSDGGSIILRNGVLLKRPPPSPDPTCVTVSPTSTTTSTTTTEQQRQHTSSNNTTYTTNNTNTSLDSTELLSDTVDIPDGIFRREDDVITKHVNTLPSFQAGFPIRLRVTESYAGYSSGNLDDHNFKADGTNTTDGTDDTTSNGDDNNNNNNDSLNASGISLLSNEEQQHFFSYDPYFSSGQYLIEQTETGEGYGNELRVTMGEQYMTLQDGDGTVWAVTRSRHSNCPSTVIYSPKERYPGQIPSSHRPTSQQRGGGYNGSHYGGHDDEEGVELYPWALVKKEGKRMDHDVAIHLVAEPSGDGGVSWRNPQSLIGGLFDSRVSFRSRHGFDEKEAHSYTTMYRVEEGEGGSGTVEGKNGVTQEREIPCCIVIRDSINRDVVDVTIAPGIDPLLIICYLAVHAKMDVEPKLCEQ